MTPRDRYTGLALALCLGIIAGCGRREAAPPVVELPAPEPAPAITNLPPPLAALAYPTIQDKLTDPTAEGVFQHTGGGNPLSGHFGSVRTGMNGLARFHEGIDIAAVERDRQGRPLDTVHAVAPGAVAYINRVGGNSDYGKYVVLIHDDPIGPVYTLYGHMAEIAPGLSEGQSVQRGDQLGRVGNTALEPIPMSRAHLHFEIGMLANPLFSSWPGRKQKNTPGGIYNGQNLLGVDPVAVFRQTADTTTPFSLLYHAQHHPVAFELLVRARAPWEYFAAHPALWEGEPYAGQAMALRVSEGGLILHGRNANSEELAALGRQSVLVIRANPEVLGRNGRRHVIERNGRWELGQNGLTWLSILAHPGGLRK